MKYVYLVLKAKYTIIKEEEIILSHLFKDIHRSIGINTTIDIDLFMQKFLFGFKIPADKSTLLMEEKLIVMISKKIKGITLITENKDEYRREINIRGVLLAATKSGVERSIIQEYYETFNDQIIYMLDSNPELNSYFQQEGLSQIRSISKEEIASLDQKNIILINEKDLINVGEIKSEKYLVYSLENLRVGPLLIPGTTICLKCYNDNYYQKRSIDEDTYPVYYRNFIMNFLVNTVYFSLNDLHKYLGIDVGLPIRKYYQLVNPYLSLSVTNVYKTSDCSLCFNEIMIG